MASTTEVHSPTVDCQHCHWPSDIIDVRPTSKGVRRRRQCTNPRCGERWSTLEQRYEGRTYALDHLPVLAPVGTPAQQARQLHNVGYSLAQIVTLLDSSERIVRRWIRTSL